MEAKVKLKELSPKKRIRYIWDYYKYWILGGIFVLSTLVNAIYQYATAKECLLNMIFINGTLSYEETLFAEDYLLDSGFSTDKYELKTSRTEFKMTESHYQQDYYTLQALTAKLISGDIDILAGPADIFEPYLIEGYLIDLRKVFTETELSTYKSNIVYTTNPDTNETYPCAFDLTNNAWIIKHGYYSESCQFGILYNCTHIEQAKDFLFYVLNY